MKANKKTLMAVKNYFKNEEGYDLDEVISDIVSETNMLKVKEMGDVTLSLDECSINWGDDEVSVLENFLSDYTEKFIDKICSVLDSFVGEDIDWYLEEEE